MIAAPLSPSSQRSASRPHRRSPHHRAFTLVEVLLTIALLALLASALILNVDRIFGGGKESVAELFVDQISKTPLKQYYFHVGNYPSTNEGLAALITAPAGTAARKWKGPYFDELPTDPWGEPYQYRFPGEKNPDGYDIWSKGPDRTSGTADDIGNW